MQLFVYGSGSQLGMILSPREYLAVSGEIFGCPNSGQLLLQPVGRGASCNEQDRPARN